MKDHIKRQIQPAIESRLGSGKAIIITGTRRVGKTFMIKAIQSNFNGKSILMNGEDLLTQELLSRRSVIHYRQILGEYQLLLLDEAQAITDVGKILKLLVDEMPALNIIATGSSSFDLSNQTGEPLTGRKIHFDLFPLSQSELSDGYETRIETYARLEERLVFGTYPEVALTTKTEDKTEYLTELVRSYLLKDILTFEQIKNSSKLLQLLQLLAYQVGNEVSLQELGRQLSLHRGTVERYLDLLSKVFIVFKLGGYSSNLRKEVVKSSKWYFHDNGVRNAVIGDFSPVPVRKDIGQLWENYLLSERIKRNSYKRLPTDYFFWRTYDQQEIDLIERQNGQLAAFECKWKEKAIKPPVFFQKNYPGVPFQVVHKNNYLDFIL
ncbi:MAG TPA: ATP-binding protein [Bacteroidetes bacterium]|nr:ATP-binding protein [Bacteroidota bacterium]